jgi:hypothetical protein
MRAERGFLIRPLHEHSILPFARLRFIMREEKQNAMLVLESELKTPSTWGQASPCSDRCCDIAISRSKMLTLVHSFFSSCGGLRFFRMDSPRISMRWAL